MKDNDKTVSLGLSTGHAMKSSGNNKLDTL